MIFFFCVPSNDRLLDLVVHPVPQPSQCMRLIQQSPTKSSLYEASHSLPVSSHVKGSLQKSTRTSELHLLETPLVVKVSITHPCLHNKMKFLLSVWEGLLGGVSYNQQ